MSIIGGTFTAQNKPLSGVYINVVSTPSVSAVVSSRGTVAVALPFNWGEPGVISVISAETFKNDSLKLFGYEATTPQLVALREIFCNASTALVYRIASQDAVAASNDYATALYKGTRGNDIKIVVAENVDDNSLYDVYTYIDSIVADKQTVDTSAQLKGNDFVSFKADAALSVTAGTPLAGGSDGGALTVGDYQAYLDKLESYSFNTLVCPVASAEVTALYTAYVKRLRNEQGARFQLITHRSAADNEGVINVENSVAGYSENAIGMGEQGLVYWVAGASAACELNRCLTYAAYNGELAVNTEYTVAQLTANKEAGKFTFYNACGKVRVLDDINSFTTFSDTKGKEFSLNQVIRATDALCNDISNVFAKDYIGVIPNDRGGRTSLWNDICTIIQGYVQNGVFSDFSTDMVTVEAGKGLGDVVCLVSGLTIAYAMAKLYLTMSIS